MTDLSNMSLADLRDLQEQIKAEMKNRESQELQQARDQILAIAQKVGVPLQALFAKGGKAGGNKNSGSTVAAKFQHPDNASQQWTGRGRQPKWVKEWIDSGNSIDKLRIA